MTVMDSLVFLGRGYSGTELDPETLLRHMDALRIDRAVVCPAKPADYHLMPANEYVASIAAQHPNRLVFICRVDPNRADAVDDLARCFDQLDARGVFLHPAEELFRIHDLRVDAVATEVDIRKRPAIVATGYPWVSEPLQVGALAERFPTLPVVMTNGGQLNISGLGMTDAWIALERFSNLHMQTAGEYRQDFIENVSSNIDASRVLFASGAPYFDQRYEMARALQAELAPNARQLMIGSNAERLFARVRT